MYSKLECLQDVMKYRFQNIDLLILALTHPSFNHSSLHNYERLELLGDSILNFVLTDFLFQKFSKSNEGGLAKMRAAVICKDAVCLVASKLALSSYIIMSSSEEGCGGRENRNNIENAMEAIIGAIYIDCNDVNIVKNFIMHLWKNSLENIDLVRSDPKTAVQEWAQKYNYGLPEYILLQKTGSDHMPQFTVKVSAGQYEATANGSSIRSAEKIAAQKIVTMIGDID